MYVGGRLKDESRGVFRITATSETNHYSGDGAVHFIQWKHLLKYLVPNSKWTNNCMTENFCKVVAMNAEHFRRTKHFRVHAEIDGSEATAKVESLTVHSLVSCY